MIRLLSVIGLEFFAILLAWVQSLGGVRTDEAKYLLNIPYPQPPLARWVLSQTEIFPFQELLWRVLFASFLLQAVWIVWWMARGFPRRERALLCCGWCLSASTLVWAGSILMAPLTMLQALLLVALTFRPSSFERSAWFPFFLGVFWLASLFTAYQIALYFPLFLALLFRSRRSCLDLLIYGGFPLALVLLYSLTNPLSFASFVNAGSENFDLPFWAWGWYLLRTWITGGSLVFAILGIVGMVRLAREWSWGLLGSFLLVSAFVFLSFRDYYDLYFTPLFIGGMASLLREGFSRAHLPIVVVGSIVSAVTLWCFHPPFTADVARQLRERLRGVPLRGEMIVSGFFGHQWQYESRLPIRRYRPEFLDSAGAVVCLASCGDLGNPWQKLDDVPVDVWVRR